MVLQSRADYECARSSPSSTSWSATTQSLIRRQPGSYLAFRARRAQPTPRSGTRLLPSCRYPPRAASCCSDKTPHHNRKHRAHSPTEIVAKSLSRAADPTWIQLAQERPHAAENAGEEEPQREPEKQHHGVGNRNLSVQHN